MKATVKPHSFLLSPVSLSEYRHPRKKWRIKQGATPTWYKARNGIRTKALSGAARVARYRPQKFN
jgi:sec-independent protein translocase protein TatB